MLDIKKNTVHCKVCLKAVTTKGSRQSHLFKHLRQTHVLQWDTCYSLQDAQDRSPQTPAKKKQTLAEWFYHCVLYDKKGSWWTVFTDAATLKIWCPYIQWKRQRFIHMLKNFRFQVCVMKLQQGLTQARGSRQANLPGPNLMSCTSTNMWWLLCSMQMFNLVYISSGIQNTVCKQKAPCAKKYLNKVMFTLHFTHTFMKTCYLLNLCLQKHFIKKGNIFFK